MEETFNNLSTRVEKKDNNFLDYIFEKISKVKYTYNL